MSLHVKLSDKQQEKAVELYAGGSSRSTIVSHFYGNRRKICGNKRHPMKVASVKSVLQSTSSILMINGRTVFGEVKNEKKLRFVRFWNVKK